MLHTGTPKIGDVCDELARNAQDIADLDVEMFSEQTNPEAIRLSRALRRQSELCVYLAQHVRSLERATAAT